MVSPFRQAGLRSQPRRQFFGIALAALLARLTLTPAQAQPRPANAANTVGTAVLAEGQIGIYGTSFEGAEKNWRPLGKGDQLYEGDTVATGADAALHVQMADGGYVAVRPNTRMRFVHYQANGDEDDHSVIALLSGGLRTITGWVGKIYPKNYAIVTPNATIGVRGTDHGSHVLTSLGEDGAETGTYDRVHSGATSLFTPQGNVDVEPGKAGFMAAHGRERPRMLAALPAFLQIRHRHEELFEGLHARIHAGLAEQYAARRSRWQDFRQRNPKRFPQRHVWRETLERSRTGGVGHFFDEAAQRDNPFRPHQRPERPHAEGN